ncbi:MAG: SDR family oxidoreductase [Acidobacteriia bacterium]|nr:SDR family oxidoreductase [Terriglobia bacterium]
MANSKPLALVTGASAGIGAAYARRLAREGYDLVLVARRRERLEALAAELQSSVGVRAEVLPADLTQDSGLKAVEDRIERAENLEFLLNNAGFGAKGRFWETPSETQDDMHRLHVLATVRLTHAALKGMTARGGGAVVNVSSVAAFVCRPGNTSYYATKLWVNGFSEGLYLELKNARSPVRVQALCPGYTLTEFHDVMGFDRRLVPRSLWTSAEDVVEASLAGLRRGDLFVVPGWRYKLLVILLRLMPRSVMYAAANLGPAWVQEEPKASG